MRASREEPEMAVKNPQRMMDKAKMQRRKTRMSRKEQLRARRAAFAEARKSAKPAGAK
jgi:hypothetical protein